MSIRCCTCSLRVEPIHADGSGHFWYCEHCDEVLDDRRECDVFDDEIELDTDDEEW